LLERARLKDFAPGEGFASGAFKDSFDDANWHDVPVPGDVHRAMIAAGRIPDPFYDRNESECAWIEDREWWYRIAFDGPEEPPAPDERLRLIFHGLDTFVTVWLGGEELGRHSNMFREAIFDVTGRVRAGAENTLALRFDRPLERVRGAEVGEWFANGIPERTAMRKAQFGYGWDWGPRLPTVGIWRPVELRRERKACIEGVHFSTVELSRDGRRALVRVEVEADRFSTDAPLSALVRLMPPGSREPVVEQEISLDRDSSRGMAYLTVEDPETWWTHDLGEPALYDLSVELAVLGGERLDRYDVRVGIRTVELDQSPDPDEPGTRFFRFVLNGVPIFAKGANWIPADSFVGGIEEERYERLIELSKDANMNMLRVWGGGIYEHDAFYKLCDRLGILVWQDFMFACAAYPEEPPDFVSEVEAEARYQVGRLRNHPSLALWCGNNENQWIHDITFWESPDFRVPGSLYYDRVLPLAVKELDGKTPYWPGSPYGGDDHNAMEDGDRHNWDVWHGDLPRRFGEEPRREPTPKNVSYLRYAEDSGRFISEFGMHASPVLQTLRQVIPPGQLYHHSPAMDHHNKDEPKNKADDLMLGVTGLPRNLQEYVDFSMIAQAEGLKFAIEHFRRRKPHCSGTLFWQLNDCWPVLSWSVLDYYGFGKAGYYYAKRAYAPILASFKPLEGGGVELWITNDTLSNFEDEAVVGLKTFSGDIVWEHDLIARARANGSRAVWRAPTELLEERCGSYLYVRSYRGDLPANRHFLVPIKDLRMEPVVPEMDVAVIGERELRVVLNTTAYAYFVHLAIPGENARFSDNYFDLEPGESRYVTVTTEVGELAPEQLSVRSWPGPYNEGGSYPKQNP
jgi:beta-mannosidase